LPRFFKNCLSKNLFAEYKENSAQFLCVIVPQPAQSRIRIGSRYPTRLSQDSNKSLIKTQ
ncbi:hypothetical protein, partial [Caldilinea sp.]|uniref:hypothetical protein n=1 Tax=Caldilinea sp. TaxID=2293560 RepID=UPI001B1D5659